MLIYKLNEAKDAILMNEKGFPIVIDDEKNNEEFGLDGAHLYSKVPELTNKISQLNKSLEINENNLDLIKGAGADLENLTDWTKKVKTALELQDNIDSQKLVEAGKIDEIKQQATEMLKQQLEEKEVYWKGIKDEDDKSIKSLEDKIYDFMVREKFGSSNFVKDKLNMTSKAAYKYFSDNIKLEKDDSGNWLVTSFYLGGPKHGEKVMSKLRVGEEADLEEALGILVNYDSDKDQLLKNSAVPGSGDFPSNPNAPKESVTKTMYPSMDGG